VGAQFSKRGPKRKKKSGQSSGDGKKLHFYSHQRAQPYFQASENDERWLSICMTEREKDYGKKNTGWGAKSDGEKEESEGGNKIEEKKVAAQKREYEPDGRKKKSLRKKFTSNAGSARTLSKGGNQPISLRAEREKSALSKKDTHLIFSVRSGVPSL